MPNEPEGKDNNQAGAPKVEIKDGKTYVTGADGKAISYVPEHQLISAKESLEKQLNEQQTAHSQAVDGLKVEVSNAQKAVAEANAKLKEAQQARESGAISQEEYAKVKEELDTTKTELANLKTQSLETRKKNLQTVMGFSEEELKDKTQAQIEALEEAANVLKKRGSSGGNNYGFSGGGGGSAPMSEKDRAAQILGSTPLRGASNNR